MAEASEKSDIYNGKLLKLQEENENLKLVKK